ncbi:MAG: hypothetical protein KF799_06780 [Bdellovibrionales bacterium]|nr:hypothetical protein [Bdellovibrionales bacterium]
MEKKNVNSSEKEGLRDRVGDLIEKAGHKISEAGMPGLGQKIHDLGDSVEKKHKNPQHPHKV